MQHHSLAAFLMILSITVKLSNGLKEKTMTQQNPVVLAEITLPTQETPTIGMTYCPGKPDKNGVQATDVRADLKAIKDWGANAVISLVNQKEMATYQVENLGERVANAGMRWFHLPFEDGGIPCDSFRAKWLEQKADIVNLLHNGGKVVVHCRGGKGRTGLICAQLMLTMGVDFDQTVSLVQQNRQGTLAKPEHIEYLKSL